MTPDNEWIVLRVDGKIASVTPDFRRLPDIAARIAALPPSAVGKIWTERISTEELTDLAGMVRWVDFELFGTKFQKSVWKALFDLEDRLYSYSELAALCGNPAGVRSVAHAVGLNPVAYLIPCHLIIPKESIDRVAEIRRGAQSTLFKGSDLYLLDTIDVGEYAYGAEMKRFFIKQQLGK